MQEYLELITTYQINLTIIGFSSIALIIAILFYYYTNDLKPAIITFCSILAVPVFTVIMMFLLYEYYNIQPTQKHLLIIWSALFINIMNLSVLISKYAREVTKKDFDIDYVTRYHFCSTLNLFVIILLTIGTVSIFMKAEMLIILISILAISSLVIWFNHMVARLLLKDQ